MKQSERVVRRFLDPDPLLLASAPGSREEKSEQNSKFHALNRAIVQLVSIIHRYFLFLLSTLLMRAD